ncbi:MAG: hypothetical protein IJG13_17470 [Kiritimatiellae bacterium]|nr:hypothetical protein [Kiritimatiellia bacterium]MBQ3341832.1 hypothetical protein [Kiritimatiellia bacterium]
MKSKTMMVIAVGFALAGAAFASDTGDALLLFKESGSFWHTATNSTLTVPIDFKDGAASATLTVRGSTYLHVYEGITTNAFTFSLPPADDVAHEDVYELSLVFDNGTEMKARIGLPYGLMAGTEGATRCIPESSSTRWPRTYGNGLIPVPAETTSLVVDGSPVTESTPGFTGAQGWLALGPVEKDATVDVEMSDGSRTIERTLVGAVVGGTMIIVW